VLLLSFQVSVLPGPVVFDFVVAVVAIGIRFLMAGLTSGA
jgi:hypothetical protein